MLSDFPDTPHDPQEAGHYAEFRITFDVIDIDGETREGSIGNIESHVHHVPDNIVVDALLILAKNIVSRSTVERVFSENVPESVKEVMLSAFAAMILKGRLDSPEVSGTGLAHVEIPNDISELLDD
jgi:hypothetical protein